jgi:hypothetical protein
LKILFDFSSVRKIRGDRAKSKAKVTVTDDGGDTGGGVISANRNAVSISTSQQSIVMRTKNFADFIQILKNEPLYKPNEPDLKVPSLTAYLDDLTAANNDAASKIPAVENARIKRNALFYTDGTGMVDVAADCKKYIKGAFGATSQEFKSVSGIKFTNPVNL